MNRAELFSDEAMGYSDQMPQLGGWSFNGYRVTDSLLPGMKEDLARMSGGARKAQRGGNAPGAPMKAPNPNPGLTASNPVNLWPTAVNLRNIGKKEEVVTVGDLGKPPVGDPVKGFTTPVKLPPEFGRVGMLPNAPRKLQFGGGSRKTRKGGRKTQRGGRRLTSKRGAKSFLNIRVTGRIRMKQRHRQ